MQCFYIFLSMFFFPLFLLDSVFHTKMGSRCVCVRLCDLWPLHFFFVLYACTKGTILKIGQYVSNIYRHMNSGPLKQKCRFMCVDGPTAYKKVLKWSRPFICMNYICCLTTRPNQFYFFFLFCVPLLNAVLEWKTSKDMSQGKNISPEMQPTHNHKKTILEYIIWKASDTLRIWVLGFVGCVFFTFLVCLDSIHAVKKKKKKKMLKKIRM